MKKPLVTLIFFLIAIVATAQTTKGTFSVGGALGIQNSKEEFFDTDSGPGETKVNTFLFEPKVGYFLADGMELGLNLSLSSTKREIDFEDADDQKLPTLSETAFGPYFKYYMFTSNEKFAFTLNASLLFGVTKQKPEEGDDLKGSSLEFAISPGFTYFFTDKIGLDFELQGIGFRTEDPNKDSDVENDKESTFIFGASSFNPSLGFKYYFGR
jgi:outer membrane protein